MAEVQAQVFSLNMIAKIPYKLLAVTCSILAVYLQCICSAPFVTATDTQQQHQTCQASGLDGSRERALDELRETLNEYMSQVTN